MNYTMLHKKVSRIFILIKYGMLTWLYAGPRIASRELAHRLYYKKVFFGTIKDLHDPEPPPSFPGYVRIASTHDMRELYQAMKSESRESRYQLLQRLYLHERGFGDCYIMRTMDTNEICFVKWFVTPSQLTNMGWTGRFPGLPADTVMSENVYTFERFRQKGVHRASYWYTRDLCLAQGFRYMGGFTPEDNIPELISIEKRGWKVFNRVLMRHFLFRVTSRILESYEPPAIIRVSKVDADTSTRGGPYFVHLVRE